MTWIVDMEVVALLAVLLIGLILVRVAALGAGFISHTFGLWDCPDYGEPAASGGPGGGV